MHAKFEHDKTTVTDTHQPMLDTSEDTPTKSSDRVPPPNPYWKRGKKMAKIFANKIVRREKKMAKILQAVKKMTKFTKFLGFWGFGLI